MYVYKAAYYDNDSQDEINCIVVLEIPANTRVRLATDNNGKCRAERAKVIGIETLKGHPLDVVAYAGHDNSFKYRVGRTVKPKKPFCPTNQECASGIHFFFTKALARAWARG